MSIPLNHHYVSQCQIKQFFNEEHGKIYLYNKVKRNFYSRPSSKGIFSEKYSNSIFKDGKIDHTTLEDDLKIFEDEYSGAVELISNTGKTRNISKDCYHSLLKITLFGIIGHLRTPQIKKGLDDAVNNPFHGLYEECTEELRQKLESLTEYKEYVSYSNVVKYSTTALRIAERMGGLAFTIWHIQSDDFFLLPDTSAFTVRRKINNYFNPNIYEIAEVGFPLTNKIFIHALSQKLGQEKSYIGFIDEKSRQLVTDINYNLFHYAENDVATRDEAYLKQVIAQVEHG
jgi:hypothetical protein